jgi:hypothetical protein
MQQINLLHFGTKRVKEPNTQLIWQEKKHTNHHNSYLNSSTSIAKP